MLVKGSLNVRKPNPLPEQQRLLEIFEYSIVEGSLRYRIRRAGRLPGQYVDSFVVRVDGILYRKSRVIWKIVTGKDTDMIVDHHDGDNTNDSWINLRLATVVENGQNAKISKRNKWGIKGIRYCSNRNTFYAGIIVNGIKIELGRFDTAEAAGAAYQAASEKHFGRFSYSRRPGA